MSVCGKCQVVCVGSEQKSQTSGSMPMRTIAIYDTGSHFVAA